MARPTEKSPGKRTSQRPPSPDAAEEARLDTASIPPWPPIPTVEVRLPEAGGRRWRNVSFEERYRDRHEELLRIAGTLADERGYDDAQISHIAALARVSLRTFYEHFESKEACFAELVLRAGAVALERFIAAAEAAIPEGPAATFRALVSAWSESLTSQSEFHLGRPALLTMWSEARRPGNPLADAFHLIGDRAADVMVVAARRLGSPLPDDLLRLAARQQVEALVAVVQPRNPEQPVPGHDLISKMLSAALGFPPDLDN